MTKQELLDKIFDVCKFNGGDILFFEPIHIFEYPNSHYKIDILKVDGCNVIGLLDEINLKDLSVQSIQTIYNEITE